jgi:hypothetical protein
MTFREILRAELVRVNRGLQDCEVLEARGHDVSNLAAARSELRREQTELLELVGSVPADTIKALINSLRQDARCGDAVRWPDPVDDYAWGLEQASQELEELL